MIRLGTTLGLAAMVFGTPTTLHAQIANPSVQEQARIRAEREAAERAAREAEPVVLLETEEGPALGPFPVEQPCFNIADISADGIDRYALQWVPSFLDRYRGRCAGSEGLDYILKSLQAQFLDRGLVTTRAGLPEQDLSSGTLTVSIIPGVVEGVRVNGRDDRGMFAAASPLDTEDLVNLRGIEQGLEQLRSVPGRQVAIDLVPGEQPGGTVLDVTVDQRRPISASIGVNNFAGRTVGRYQGTGQIALLGQLGLSEVISGYYNQRVNEPGIPANSQGGGVNVSVPYGWWTFGASGSMNRYSQTVFGNVTTFGTRGKLDRVAAYAERVIARDQTSKTSASVGFSRRWGRNFIDDVEIGIQRQDLTDIELRLLDRRTFGNIRLDSAYGLRLGVNLLGAQDEDDDRPSQLPTGRYRIFNTDIAVTVPLTTGYLESYRGEFHGQVSGKQLYGSDLIQVGGPFSVRGLDSDFAELGNTGYYTRQELTFRITDEFRPYLLFDFGQVENGTGLRGGAGGGLRAVRGPLSLDAFAALPTFGNQIMDVKTVRFGFSANLGF